MEDKNQSATGRYQARRTPFPTRAWDWPTAPRVRPLELKLDLTANSAHQLFLEASSSWPNTANHSGWNALPTMQQPFSPTLGILFSVGPISQFQTLQKWSMLDKRKWDKIVWPVLCPWNQSSKVSAQGPSHSKLKQVESCQNTWPVLRTRLIWPFRLLADAYMKKTMTYFVWMQQNTK